MTPDINSKNSDGRNLGKQIERQMGCMTGIFQLFDRHQMLAGKRFDSDKRLPSFSTSDSLSPSERSDVSSTSFVKAAPPSPSSPSLGGLASSPENYQPAKPSLPLPLPVFEVKNGVKTSWKLREAPRLSLDSRAVFDAKGKLRPREIPSDCSDDWDDHDKHRRSPSVVARLMGLDALPVYCNEEQSQRSELRRSASESRASRDLSSQFNFQKLTPNSEELFLLRKGDCSNFRPRNSKPEPPRAPPDPMKRKSYFEAQEFFPEPKLRMRGIEEPAKDLETLKQILEALQLKGLLHSKLPILASTESPVTLTKPSPKPMPKSASSRRPVAPQVIPSFKSRRDPVRRSLMRPPELNESSRSPEVRRRPFNVERPIMSSQPERRSPAIHSPVASPNRLGLDQVALRSAKIRRPKPEISPDENVSSLGDDDAAFALCDTSILSSSTKFDFQQRASAEQGRTGRGLLERCDKLLHSIAAITSSVEQVTATDQQPSPVSVLDSSFLSEENSASPLPKRAIDFEDQIADWEDHRKPKATPNAGSESSNGSEKKIGAGQPDDYAFVADVVRETDRHGPPHDTFSALEQRHWFSNSSTVSVLHRLHIFDIVTEILERKRNAPPWTAFTRFPSPCNETSLLQEVWDEVQRLRKHVATENVMELTGKVIKQDMEMTAAGEQEWRVSGVEMSAAVLHIERQLFKDMVSDTIRELADLACKRRATAISRRKLIF